MKTKLDDFVNWFIYKYGKNAIDIIKNKPEEISEMLYDALKETVLNKINKIKPKEINTIDDLAKLLDNNYNGDELNNPYDINVEELCKKNKWVVLFPYYDDTLEARGYIDGEIYALGGIKALLYKKGDFYPEDVDECIYKKAKSNMIYGVIDEYVYNDEVKNGRIGIDLQWCPDGKTYTWFMTTKFENAAYFNIIDEDDDDGDIWARCCVIDCSNVL